MATPAQTSGSDASSATRNNIGPLTTTYTPPSECQRCTLATNQVGTGEYYSICEAYISNLPCHGQTWSLSPCLPHVTDVSSQIFGSQAAFYSPGLACPSGWQTVATVASGAKGANFGLVSGIDIATLLPNETAALCCPTGYAYSYQTVQTTVLASCVQLVLSSSASFMTCGPSSYIGITQTDIGTLVDSTSTKTNGVVAQTTMLYQSVQMLAPTLQLNYRAQDLTLLSSKSPSQSQSQSATGHANSGSSSTLSGGAIAGIVIGAVIVVVVVAAIAWWLLRRRRIMKPKTSMSNFPGGYDKPELDGAAARRASDARLELEDTERRELEAMQPEPAPTELHGQPVTPMAELPGS